MSVTIRDLMTNDDLFGGIFSTESWIPWVALLSAFHGIALNRQERHIFEAITRRSESPQEACRELWLIIGRRGGKSQCAALLAVYYACFQDYRDRLSPGELATIRVMAADKPQARTVMRYINGLIDSNPMLKRMIVSQARESIELNNRCIIEVGTASFRSARGYTFAAVIGDELAFWRSEDSANPDYEILNAVRPGLATLDGKLIILSSPYSKRGELWKTHQKHYGKPGSILVAKAASRVMNPSLQQSVVDEAMERDPAAASAEYMAEFRSDLEQFLSREAVDMVARTSPKELPFDKKHNYFGFADPAGGGADEYCVAIGHMEGDQTIVDLVRARKSGTPSAITKEYASLFKTYNISSIKGDRYAGSWPGDEFRKFGIAYRANAKPKSDLYIELLPTITSGRIELPPDDRLLNQLSGLERRTSRSGKDSIDHPPGGHDDRCNVIAGLTAETTRLIQTTRTVRLKYL